MSLFNRLRRATEGNKALSRQVISFLKKRDKIISAEWTGTLRPLFISLEKEIISKIKSYPNSFWDMANLKSINREIAGIVGRFDTQFSEALVAGQKNMVEITVDQINRQLMTAGLGNASLAFDTQKVLGGISPLTKVITENFASDIAKKINSEIAFSLSSGEGAFKLAGRLEEMGLASKASAERIAVTEMNRSASLAQQIRGEELSKDNPEIRKVWISSHSLNAREEHLKVEQKSMANPLMIDEDFDVDGEPALYPHDPRLSAGNSVNCKCTIVYVNANNPESLKMLSPE